MTSHSLRRVIERRCCQRASGPQIWGINVYSDFRHLLLSHFALTWYAFFLWTVVVLLGDCVRCMRSDDYGLYCTILVC